MARALSGALGAEAMPQGAALPLSRLPDVPSMFAPMRSSSLPGSVGAPPVTMHAGGSMSSASQPPPDNVGPGGTLASPHGRAVMTRSEPPPNVVMVGTSHGTLPSENLPMFSAHGVASRRGVAPWLVIVLVLGALVAGFLLGYAMATARSHAHALSGESGSASLRLPS
jgi:hypothetical protein